MLLPRRGFLGFFAAAGRGLRAAPFQTDVTPPPQTPLCYGLVPDGASVQDPLQARGLVILPEGQPPVVLCAVDWLGIGNGSRDRWRIALARACGTTPERVALHTVHQHDAPGDDLSAQALLPSGMLLYDEAFAAAAVRRVAAAAKAARPRRITHIGVGKAPVDRIASNRRILGRDGKIQFGRMTSCRNSPHCDAAEGVIDPLLRSISFLADKRRVATLSYYATHPMSYYGKGEISSDFVGHARNAQRDTFQIHFTGAAGNIGAGKYNDGAPENRAALTARLGAAMTAARQTEEIVPYDGFRWVVSRVELPPRPGREFSEEAIVRALADEKLEARLRRNNARYLAFLRLTKAGRQIDLSAFHTGGAKVLHMPGELFVEYQLHAGTAMAAYGDYGPMYIGTRRAYDEGGYETSAVSRVGPAVEEMLHEGMRRLY
ncbi:MAG: hypothetical protein FJW30_00440 [Acidobacteria bacterium]|nr:hypothetical protein [Acidobacteriota bacterium]